MGLGETRGAAARREEPPTTNGGPAAAFGGVQLRGIAARHVLRAPEQVLQALVLTAGPVKVGAEVVHLLTQLHDPAPRRGEVALRLRRRADRDEPLGQELSQLVALLLKGS